MDRNELTLAIAGALVAAFLLGWMLRWAFGRLNAAGPRNAARTADIAARLHAAEDAQHRAERAAGRGRGRGLAPRLVELAGRARRRARDARAVGGPGRGDPRRLPAGPAERDADAVVSYARAAASALHPVPEALHPAEEVLASPGCCPCRRPRTPRSSSRWRAVRFTGVSTASSM